MNTNISICSAALLQLGKAPIASFDDASDGAKLCANLYPAERDSLLREFAWNCVVKRAILAPSSTAPEFGFSAAFLLPSDFLRLVAVGDWRYGDPMGNRFRLEGRHILASGNALALEYVFRNEVEDTWDAKLVELMQARMLWKLAYPVTQSTTLRDTLAQEYKALAMMARSIDSQENPGDALGQGQSPLLAARLGAGYGWGY